MNSFGADMPTWLQHWGEGMLRACWQGGLAILLAWGICSLAPRMPAGIRCWLWRLAYLKLLAALLLFGPIHLPVLPSNTSTAASTSYFATTPSPPSSEAPSPIPAAPPAAPNGYGEPTGGLLPYLPLVLVLAWAAGVAWSIARVVREWLAARSLHEGCEVSSDPWLTDRCAELAFLYGLRRVPRILLAEGRGSPLLVGSRGPAVLLPAAVLRDYTPAEVELMLAHELAHLKRGDLLWSWLPAVAHWLFFFHPLVWLANREWRVAQEMACDELALETTSAPPAEYGGVLVRVAAQSRLNLQAGLAAVGVEESPDTLKRRLEAMKHARRFEPGRVAAASLPIVLVGALAILPWKVTRADGSLTSAGKELRYGWQPNRTYTYEVTLEAEREDYIETFKGHLSYRAQPGSESVTLVQSGMLYPQRRPRNPAAFPVFATGYHPMPIGFPSFGEPSIRINPAGRIFEERSGVALPLSLGSAARLVVEPLPEREVGAWNVAGDREVVLDESRPGRQQAGAPQPYFGPGSRSTARLTARETGRYSVLSADGKTAVIRKEYELRSLETLAGTPALQLTASGRFRWDLEQGLPRSMELRGTLTEASSHVTQRTPFTLRYTLQEAGPSASTAGSGASTAAPPPRPAAATPNETVSILADLRGGDRFKRQSAASRLVQMSPNQKREEVAAALQDLLKDDEQFVRLFAVRALKSWGTRAQTQSIIGLQDDDAFAVRWAAIEVLGAMKDPRGIEALADMVAREHDRSFAFRALQQAGPAAEGSVLKLLDHSEAEVRTEACRVLQQIGTGRSLAALGKLAGESDAALAGPAEQAAQAIRGRE